MGMSYPMYNIDVSIVNKVLKLIESIIADNWSEKDRAKITYRPLRPEEINENITKDTRIYDTTLVGTGYERILAASYPIKVKTGSIYLFYGWVVINDPSNAMTLATTMRIRIDGVARNEVSTRLVDMQENQSLLTLDQIIEANEDSTIDIEVKDSVGGKGGHAIIYPLAVRIGPKAQLDVS